MRADIFRRHADIISPSNITALRRSAGVSRFQVFGQLRGWLGLVFG